MSKRKNKSKYVMYALPSIYTMYGTGSDPMGSYTGYPVMVDEPEQDVDDL